MKNKIRIIISLVLSLLVIVFTIVCFVTVGTNDWSMFIMTALLYMICTYLISYNINELTTDKISTQLTYLRNKCKEFKNKVEISENMSENRRIALKKTIAERDDYKRKLELIVKEHKQLVEKYNLLINADNLKDSEIRELKETIKGYEIITNKQLKV